MKNIILIVLMSVSLLSYGQKPKNIDNTLTEKHINIPGTRLYVIPPHGFEIATSFVGMQGDNTVFQVLDLVEGDFYSNAATFCKKEFKKEGIKVFEYAEFKVNEFPAKYIHMQGNPDYKTISILFGDNTFSTMVMVYYASEQKETKKEIQKTIQTIYYDKNLQIDPLESVSFTLDDSISIFKFYKSTAGMFFYSIDGKEDISTDGFILVSTIPMDETMTPQSVSEMFISSLEQKGLTVEEIKTPSIMDVNGYSAYEVETYGELSGKKCLIYHLIVAGEDKVIAIQGYAYSDFENNLNEFKKLAKTIKLK